MVTELELKDKYSVDDYLDLWIGRTAIDELAIELYVNGGQCTLSRADAILLAETIVNTLKKDN